MTLPRMILIAVALLVPAVAVALVLAEWLAPVIDRQSVLAQSMAYLAYALGGACGGFVIGGQDSAESPHFSALREADRRAFVRKFAVAIAILLVPLLAVNLLLAQDRLAFLHWELRVLGALFIGGAIGFAVRRLLNSRHTRT